MLPDFGRGLIGHRTKSVRIDNKMAAPILPFKAALNASTLFPFELDIKQQVRIAVAWRT